MAERPKKNLLGLEPNHFQMFSPSLSVLKDNVGIGVRRSPRISERDIELKTSTRRIPPRAKQAKFFLGINETESPGPISSSGCPSTTRLWIKGVPTSMNSLPRSRGLTPGLSNASRSSRRPQEEFSDDDTDSVYNDNKLTLVQRIANSRPKTWPEAKHCCRDILLHARHSLWDSKSESGRRQVLLAVVLLSLVAFFLPRLANSAKRFSQHSRNVFLSIPDLFNLNFEEVWLQSKWDGQFFDSTPDTPKASFPDLNLLVDKLISDPKFQDLVRAEHSKGNLPDEYESRFSDFVSTYQRNGEQTTNKIQSDIQTLRKKLQEKVDQTRTNIPKLQSELETLKSTSSESQRVFGSKLASFKIELVEVWNDVQRLKQSRTDSCQVSGRISSLERKLDSDHRLVSKIVNDCQQNLTKVEAQVSGLVKEMLEQKKVSLDEEVTSTVAEIIDRLSLQERFDKLSADLRKEIKDELEVLVRQSLESNLRNSVETCESSINHLKSGNISTHSQTNVSSDIDEVSRVVQEVLLTYDADKTGLFDFALESSGGFIASTEANDVFFSVYSIFGLPLWWIKSDPWTILKPGSNPGQCWAFTGSHGSVVIGLSKAIFIGAVTLEHVPSSLAPDGRISSAPKQIQILGLASPSDKEPKFLGNFTYAKDLAPLQTFFLSPKPSEPYSLVELRILSNHGNAAYTCLYRFRVHGKLDNSSLD